MTYTQKRLWLLYQLDPDNPAFNLPAHVTLYEAVEVGVVRRVLEKLVQRHESFRTYFKELQGEPVQILLTHVAVDLAVVDCSGSSGGEREQAREDHLRQERIHPFGLEEPPLFRAKIIKGGEEEFDVLLTLHHIIADGWSLEVLEREFSLLYDAYKTGSAYELPLLRVEYKDYVYWHNGLLSDRENMRGAREFWETQLKGDAPVLPLPYDFPRKNLESKSSAGYRLVIPETAVRALQAVAQQCKASLFMVLLAGFNLLLWRVTGQRDIILGVPGAARQHEDLKHISGLFVNTLILRNRVEPGEPFMLFLERVQQTMLQVLEYQDYPLELICSEFKIKYPEINVFFNMSLFGIARGENHNDSHAPRHIEAVQNAKFDLVSYLGEDRNRVTVETHYYRELFKPVTLEKVMQLYLAILEHIGKEPGKKIEEYDYSLSGKKRKLHPVFAAKFRQEPGRV